MKSVFATKLRTAFFGFYNNILAFEGLFMDYVENGAYDELYTFKFSQDHLETYLGTIRRLNGCNDNPTPIQFSGAFRKLLICSEIMTSKHSNVINNDTQVLTTSSRKKATATFIDIRGIKDVEIEFEYDETLREELSKYDQHYNALLASDIELDIVKYTKRCCKKECQKCIDVFVEDEVINDSFVDMQQKHGMYVLPSQEIVARCTKREPVLPMVHYTQHQVPQVQFMQQPQQPETQQQRPMKDIK
ncbi:uncharacterized protein LOC116350016 [Contarinia nasturtii]|uniref:uncharacterized protein LOC116350016 n=1 Tax=Contarinia nasturtii TaxID=265458 RepID=UPI0012D485E2|nr:uncharacterized protein LOC116350016 [Contarinia nasturtii]